MLDEGLPYIIEKKRKIRIKATSIFTQ